MAVWAAWLAGDHKDTPCVVKTVPSSYFSSQNHSHSSRVFTTRYTFLPFHLARVSSNHFQFLGVSLFTTSTYGNLFFKFLLVGNYYFPFFFNKKKRIFYVAFFYFMITWYVCFGFTSKLKCYNCCNDLNL